MNVNRPIIALLTAVAVACCALPSIPEPQLGVELARCRPAPPPSEPPLCATRGGDSTRILQPNLCTDAERSDKQRQKSTRGGADRECEDSRVSPEMVLETSPLAKDIQLSDLSGVDVLEVTPEMSAFLDEHMGDVWNRYARMKRLVAAVMQQEDFNLVYDESTRTARETFEDRRGNCLSFTNMFVAMARYLDIHASYQEVDIPPDWSLAGDTFLFTQHVNVHVDLGADEVRVVDFNIDDFRTTYERRVISDQRARAHYFSNIGADHMLAGRTPEAYLNFRQAIKEDATFEPAWINMGILHRREKLPGYAETAYLQALEIDRFNLVAMSNLASLYEEAGLTEEADVYRQRVKSHRMRNPYYRYELAKEAVIAGDYRIAIDHLKFAIRKREEESRFYSLLSISYMMSGDNDEAELWMRKAEAVTAQGAERERYHHKFEWLMSQGGHR